MTGPARRRRWSGSTRRAPSCLNSRTGWMTRPGSLPSYRWNRPWSITTDRPASVPRRSRPACPGAVAAGQPGRSANGIATASSRSSASPPRPEPRTIPTSGTMSVRVRTAATRAARRAGWSAGGIGRVGSTVGVSGDIGASTTHRRSTGEAGGFSGPTEVSTPGCRSRPVGLGPAKAIVVRRQPWLGNEAPEATGGGANVP